jgi:hypothetical protein
MSSSFINGNFKIARLYKEDKLKVCEKKKKKNLSYFFFFFN